MRCPLTVANRRRVLCIFPAYTPSFGTFNHAYKLMKGVRAFMPPQGLLLIAAYMPEGWPVRFVDENIRQATAAEIYPDVDYLHIGEMGDATDEIIALVDESCARPQAQMRFTTKERLPLQ